MKASDKLPLKHRLWLSAILVSVISFAAITLAGSTSPRTNSQIKGFIAAALCVVLLAALWIPLVGRLLLRLFGR
jgi:FtsH-binding integral membrane protein